VLGKQVRDEDEESKCPGVMNLVILPKTPVLDARVFDPLG
jgi:hypothetical protein